MSKRKIDKTDIILIILLALAAVLEFGKFTFVKGDAVLNDIVYMTVSRFVATLFFVILILSNKIRVFEKTSPASILSVSPCLLVAICNMPVLQLIKGEATVNSAWWKIILFALECLMIGAFEELAFRGLLLPLALKKYGKSKKSILVCIVVTSAVFGLYHLVNLFMGAGIGPTLLQVCYSALVGAMCAAVMLFTGNVIFPVLLHGFYNFCGMLVDSLGAGVQWDIARVIVFAIVSAAVFLYMLWLYFKTDKYPLVENL